MAGQKIVIVCLAVLSKALNCVDFKILIRKLGPCQAQGPALDDIISHRQISIYQN